MTWLERVEAVTRREDPDVLLTKHEAADLLGVHWRTVQKWAKEGRLRRVVLGPKTMRYRLGDVRQLIRESGGR